MTALDSIITWAESDLPEWQSDAVRRLLTQDALTDGDRQDILLMIKELHSLLPDGVISTKPQPLQKGMVSGAPTSTVSLTLKALKNLNSINKIPDGSSLLFGHQGLTAIYGENGSGKTGYARVLKRACRARDTKERILPNVFCTEMLAPAKATFKFSISDGTDQESEWEDGKPSDEVLTNITVFDSKCARIIVDEKNETTYLPYGCHVFGELVNLLNWIREQIETEKPKIEPLQLPEITPTTTPGIFLDHMTHETTEKEVEEAVAWADDADARRLETLTKHLAELEAKDPAKLAAALRSQKERVMKLKRDVGQLSTALSDDCLAKLAQMAEEQAEAHKAVEIASQDKLQEEPLAGAGETAWQMLYKAAKHYSTSVAYPESAFPMLDDNARCVLCMQPLTEEARQRFLRFQSFMEQTAKKKYDEAKEALEAALEPIHALKSAAKSDLLANTIGEVKQRDDNLAEVAASFLAAMNRRLEYCDLLSSREETGEVPPLPASPAESLDKMIEALEKEAEDFDKAVDPVEKDKLKTEKAELLARKCFVKNRAKILEYIAGIKSAHKCGLALDSINITAITRKGKSIISEALTPQLREAIQAELKKFGADKLPINLKSSGRQGETLHQLELRGAQTDRKVSLTDVLSEGEQRVLALAGFFAEIGLGENTCPIVLDDPVSSLDHRYRSRIAARIITESKKRQVLVFTHDIAFLLDLQEKAGVEGTCFTPQTVLHHNESAGVSNEGLPWHAKSVKHRLQYLREKINKIKQFHGSEQPKYNREAAFLYALLRESWEAAIEEYVFNKTVVRHGNEVQTLRLKEVGVSTEQYKAIDVNMSKCSTWMPGHDKSKTLDAHRPEPKEILSDIETLNAFIKECKKAGEALRRERDAALAPEAPPVG